MDPRLSNKSLFAKFASSKQQRSLPSQRQIGADGICSLELSRKLMVRSIITHSTPVELTRDGINETNSPKSLPILPVNDISIQIPQNYDDLTILEPFIVVNPGGEGPWMIKH